MRRIRKNWSRRDFFRAAGLSSVAAALAPLVPLPKAEGATEPKRLILVHSAHGTDMTRWRPIGGETNFTLSSQLAPLEPYRDRMLILDGVDNAIAYEGAAYGHFGTSTLWTGVPVPPGDLRFEAVGWPRAESIDRRIGMRIGSDLNFYAFHFGCFPVNYSSSSNQGPNGVAFYRAAGQPIEPEIDPARAYDRLFDGVTGSATESLRLRQRRGSVVDVVRGEIERVRSQLPRADQDRLDIHLTSVRELETRLSAQVPLCAPSTRPAPPDIRSSVNHATVSKMQFALMNIALSCDLTRVVCFHWSHSEGSAEWLEDEGFQPFASRHGNAHEMSYEELGHMVEGSDEARVNASNEYTARAQMLSRDLLGNMAPEVLDSSLLVWASEMSEGGNHSNNNVPLVMIQGNDFDYFDTGRYLRWGEYDPITNHRDSSGRPSNELLVSLCQAMGLDDVDFVGDQRFSRGPLQGLR